MNKEYQKKNYQEAFDPSQFVRKSTFFLSLALVFLLGGIVGNFIGKMGTSSDTTTKREFTGGTTGFNTGMEQSMVNAILQTEEQLAKEPNNAAAWQRLGDLYYDTAQPEKSIAAYEKSLAINSDNPNALVDCGVMYREVKNFDKALENFQRAISIDPKHEVAHFNSGVVLIHDLNRKEEGLAMWNKLLQINPSAKAPSGMPLAELIKETSQR